jgi:hypothetical protein
MLLQKMQMEWNDLGWVDLEEIEKSLEEHIQVCTVYLGNGMVNVQHVHENWEIDNGN